MIEFFEEEDRFYLVFEKMRGGTWGLGDISSWVLMGRQLRATRENLSEGPAHQRGLVGSALSVHTAAQGAVWAQ